MDVHVVDPWADPVEVQREYGLKLSRTIPTDVYFGAVIVTLAHQQFVR